MKKINIALAEDNNNLALSIIEKLELFSEDLEFKFRSENGNVMLKELESNSDIDVILMDIEMPVMDGITATELINRKFPDISIIMLTVFDDDEKIFKSIQAGASGYLLKDESPDKLFEGIMMIKNGGAPMSPSIALKALDLLRNPGKINKIEDVDYSLTKRETEVLTKLSEGLDYNKIAELLFVSPKTIRKHIENIYKKLQVHNKIQAVQKAIKHNIIKP